MRPWTFRLVFAVVIVLLAAGSHVVLAERTSSEPLTNSGEPDPASLVIAAIKEADRAYVDAWLTNDAGRVMATLTDDAVIMPFGIPAIEGTEAIRTFWWPPDSPPATITEFTTVQHDAGGGGDIGYVRGSFSLSFEYAGKMLSNHGDYISILRRLPDGSWRVSHRAWNDLEQ